MVKKGAKATPSASMRPRADLNTGLIPSFNLVEGLDALGVHIDVMQAEFQHLFASYDDFTAQKRMIVTDLQSEASDNDPCTFMRTSDSAKWQCFDLPPSYANNREISTWPASDWQLAFCKAACAAVKAQQPICEDMSTTLDVLEHVKGTVAKWGATLSWDNMHEAMFLYFHGWPMEELVNLSSTDVRGVFFASHPVLKQHAQDVFGTSDHWTSHIALPQFRGICPEAAIFEFDTATRAEVMQKKSSRKRAATSSLLKKSKVARREAK